jgi:hypothetical protein
MVKDFLDLAKSLLGIQADLSRSAFERRERVASYLDKIVNCIEQIIESFRKEKIPYNQCSELDEYLDLLIEVIGKEVGEDRLWRYKEILNNAAETRGQYVSAFLQGSYLSGEDLIGSTPEAELQILEDAAGRFKALANSLRV